MFNFLEAADKNIDKILFFLLLLVFFSVENLFIIEKKMSLSICGFKTFTFLRQTNKKWPTDILKTMTRDRRQTVPSFSLFLFISNLFMWIFIAIKQNNLRFYDENQENQKRKTNTHILRLNSFTFFDYFVCSFTFFFFFVYL